MSTKPSSLMPCGTTTDAGRRKSIIGAIAELPKSRYELDFYPINYINKQLELIVFTPFFGFIDNLLTRANSSYWPPAAFPD